MTSAAERLNPNDCRANGCTLTLSEAERAPRLEDDGEPDEVGEADLALATAVPIAVDDLAIDLEQLGWNVAEAGCRRHRQAALHVGGDGRTGASIVPIAMIVLLFVAETAAAPRSQTPI